MPRFVEDIAELDAPVTAGLGVRFSNSKTEVKTTTTKTV